MNPNRALAEMAELQKLTSLLLALEDAIAAHEWTAALGLGLRLLGIIEGQFEQRRGFVAGIKRQVLEHIDAARAQCCPALERNALAQAGCPAAGPALFAGNDVPVDIRKIASSQYYRRPAATTTSGAPSSDETIRVNKGKRQLHPEAAARASRYLAPNAGEPKPVSILRYTSDDDSKKRGKSDEHEDKKKGNGHAGENSKRLKCSSAYDTTDDSNDMDDRSSGFITAKQKWVVDSVKKGGARPPSCPPTGAGAGASNGRTLGMPRRNVRSNFISPLRGAAPMSQTNDDAMNESTSKCLEMLAGPDGELPDKLRNLEPRLLEHISNEIMEKDSNVRWDDIAGLEYAKKCVTEMVIWPLLRPDLFHGCRSPEKGLLLFGPPGTGKTMIGKAIASEARATFFSISASSLTSKWIGEGEKLVRALFGVASCRQPAVIFIDEVDSLLSQRKSDGEHESSRRIKTQFLIEMEGIGSGNEQILLIGATNRPQELDEAARRRFSKRLYIPLPSSDARAWIVRSLLQKDGLLSLSESEIQAICSATEGYSGSDMKNLVKEASMWPLREALREGTDISKINNEEMRPISATDFSTALQQVRPSVSKSELGTYEDWNGQFGSVALTS